MALHNLLTCAGFEGAQKATTLSTVASGCMVSRFSLVLLFFLIAIIRKWGAEEWGIEFNFWIALGLGLGLYIILITLTGSVKISLVVGLIAALIGGYGGGMIYESGGDY